MRTQDFPVLLVEDDPNDVLFVQRAFRKANLANPLDVVGDGEQALAHLAAIGSKSTTAPVPALVLLDLKLPRRSGFEVLEWLRVQSALRHIPVVVLTSSRETVDIERAYDLGANSYLVKPVSFESLLEMVKALSLYWLILNESPVSDDRYPRD